MDPVIQQFTVRHASPARGLRCTPRLKAATALAHPPLPCSASTPLLRSAAQVNGLNAATFTPYAEDGSVDLAAIDAHCADLAKNLVPFAFSA